MGAPGRRYEPFERSIRARVLSAATERPPSMRMDEER